MTRINTHSDLIRYVSECNPTIQAWQYNLSYDDLMDAVSHDLYDLIIEEHDFKYGDEMPKVESDKFYKLFAQYEHNFNAWQTLASSIAGWDPEDSGARSEEYYECDSKEEKIEHLKEYALNVFGMNRLDDSAWEKIYEYLETDFKNQNEKIHAFRDL